MKLILHQKAEILEMIGDLSYSLLHVPVVPANPLQLAIKMNHYTNVKVKVFISWCIIFSFHTFPTYSVTQVEYQIGPRLKKGGDFQVANVV